MKPGGIPFFLKGTGLVYENQDEKYVIWEFCPEVVSATIYRQCKSGNIQYTVYIVRLLDKDGTELGSKELKRIDNIPYYNLWGIPDADLTSRKRQLILKKLQWDITKIGKKDGLLAEAGFHNNPRMLVLGDKVISAEKMNVIVQYPFPLKDTALWDKLPSAEINRELMKIMEIWPEVTVPLFYVTMLSVIRYLRTP